MTTFTVPNTYVVTDITLPNDTPKSGRYPSHPGRASWVFNLLTIAAAEGWTVAGTDVFRIIIPTPALGVVSVSKITDVVQADTIAIYSTVNGTTTSGICPQARSTATATIATSNTTAAVGGICTSPATIVNFTLAAAVPTILLLHVVYRSD